MTALDLVRRIRANPKGSDFQDVKHVEEFLKAETRDMLVELRDYVKGMGDRPPTLWGVEERLDTLLKP